MGFGLRIGGLGGLRAGAEAAVSAAPAPAVGVERSAAAAGAAGVVVVVALDAGVADGLFDDASVAILYSLQAFLSIM